MSENKRPVADAPTPHGQSRRNSSATDRSSAISEKSRSGASDELALLDQLDKPEILVAEEVEVKEAKPAKDEA
ncbi:hypothetical protein GGF37_007274, partial [Kickxella alabastrina]